MTATGLMTSEGPGTRADNDATSLGHDGRRRRTIGRALGPVVVVIGAALAVGVWLAAPASAAAPNNDNFDNATLLPGPVGEIAGNNVGATGEYFEPDHAERSAESGYNRSVWYRWTAPESGIATLNMSDESDFLEVVVVYTGSGVSTLTRHATAPLGWVQVKFPVVAGTAYHIVVDGIRQIDPRCQTCTNRVPNDSGTFRMQWAVNPPANDDFGTGSSLSGVDGTLTASNRRATRQPAELNHAGLPPSVSVWFDWTAPASGAAVFTTRGSSFDTTLDVSTGDTVYELRPLGESNDYGGFFGSRQSRVEFTAVAGTKYRIAVDGAGGARGEVVLQWAVNRPANDDFAKPAVISGVQGTATGTNVRSTGEPGEPNHAKSAPDRTVWYAWTPQESGPATITTRGSSFDTTLAVYEGSSLPLLTQVAANDDWMGNRQSKVALGVAAGRIYRIAVDGYNGQTGAISLQWAVNPPPNDDFSKAQVLAGAEGRTSGTTVRSTGEPGEPNHAGSAPDRSVWYAWTAPESGPATFTTRGSGFDTTLAVYQGSAVGGLTSMAANDNWVSGNPQSKVAFGAVAGTTYRIAVDGAAAQAGSLSLQWSVNPPANDDLAKAQLLSGPEGSVTGTNVRATGEPGEPNLPDNTVWYGWTAPESGRATFSTRGSGFDTVLGVFTGTSAGNLGVVGSSGDYSGSFQSKVDFTATAGTAYRVAVAGSPGQNGPVMLGWSVGRPGNDDLSTASVLGAGGGSVTGTNLRATPEPGEPGHGGSGPSRSVWYDWTAPQSGTVAFATTGSSFDTVMAAYTGSALTRLTLVAANDDSGPGQASLIGFPAVAGTTYHVVVDGFAASVGTVNLAWGYQPPAVSIGDASQLEADVATTMSFPVSLSGPSAQPVTVNYTTGNGSARAPGDYNAVSGTLTFEPGELTKAIAVTVAGDTAAEADETFTVVLFGPTNATVARATGTGTIRDDDTPRELRIGDTAVVEGNAGTTNATFTVSLSAGSTKPVQVTYATAEGTAKAGPDYFGGVGTLNFAPGETTKSVTLPVNGDVLDEPDETFTVVLSQPVNGVIVKGTGVATIVDDDAPPSVSIADASMAEGNSGTTPATFTVTLSAPSGKTVTVAYSTGNGTATAPDDFHATSGAVTFLPGERTKSISVTVKGDTLLELNETFVVTLSGPVNTSLATATGVGTIVNDD